MSFGVIFRSNLAFTVRAHKTIGKNALFAAANVARTEAIKAAMRGMTSGDRVTPHLAKNIFVEVNWPKKEAYIGTPVKHGLYWEEGHNNIFLGRYIRVPWLTRAIHGADFQKAATKAADRTAKRFGGMALERLVGLTPIGSLRSTIG